MYAFVVDTGDDSSVRQLVAAVQDRLGGIDILVNCAARPAGQAPPLSLPEITGDAFWSDVNVKVMGYLRCAHEDWDDYRAAMVADRRAVVRLTPDRAYGMLNLPG